MATKKASLGRGISAILEEVEEAYAADIRGNGEAVLALEIDSIKPNPFQPRSNFDESALKELADSIKQHGLLQPIVVIEQNGSYVLIAGERRLRASKIAGFETIRAVVADITYGKLRELALIENIQRQDLNPLELAQSFHELINEHDLTHEALSDIVGKSRVYVTNILRLLQLGDYAQVAIREERISYGHGKILVGLDPDQERKLVDSIANQKLSVRETEGLLQTIRQSRSIGGSSGEAHDQERVDLGSVLAALHKSGFAAKAQKNRLIVTFTSQKECDRFYATVEN
ncbi:putative chromosome-partitioning protein ParB [Campylobacterota bacterium]|nr:putative chromosome-partitioning protein ParB [Campylobacterota bacterium]